MDRPGTRREREVMAGDVTLDAVGLLCPLPVLKARKRLRSMQPDQVLRLLASDPAALIDVPHFCHESGNELLGIEELGDGTRAYLIRRT
jgi:tRNA 2-thiouridine synthesizing protein A